MITAAVPTSMWDVTPARYARQLGVVGAEGVAEEVVLGRPCTSKPSSSAKRARRSSSAYTCPSVIPGHPSLANGIKIPTSITTLLSVCPHPSTEPAEGRWWQPLSGTVKASPDVVADPREEPVRSNRLLTANVSESRVAVERPVAVRLRRGAQRAELGRHVLAADHRHRAGVVLAVERRRAR